MKAPPLFRDRSRPAQIVLGGVIPLLFGGVVGIMLGVSAGAYWGLAALAVAYFRTNISRVLLFWAAFILTRPLGSTVGDFLDCPVVQTVGSEDLDGGPEDGVLHGSSRWNGRN